MAKINIIESYRIILLIALPKQGAVLAQNYQKCNIFGLSFISIWPILTLLQFHLDVNACTKKEEQVWFLTSTSIIVLTFCLFIVTHSKVRVHIGDQLMVFFFWRHNHQEERADTTYKLQPNVYICLHVHHMYLSQLTLLC